MCHSNFYFYSFHKKSAILAKCIYKCWLLGPLFGIQNSPKPPVAFNDFGIENVDALNFTFWLTLLKSWIRP